MQTDAPHRLTSLQLSFLINACALPVMLLHHASGLARAGCRQLRRRAPPNKPRTAAAAAPPAGLEALATPLLDVEAQQAASGPRPTSLPAGLPTKCRVLLSTTLALTTLMLAQVRLLQLMCSAVWRGPVACASFRCKSPGAHGCLISTNPLPTPCCACCRSMRWSLSRCVLGVCRHLAVAAAPHSLYYPPHLGCIC